LVNISEKNLNQQKHTINKQHLYLYIYMFQVAPLPTHGHPLPLPTTVEDPSDADVQAAELTDGLVQEVNLGQEPTLF
jgi:hypothetical protein